MPLFRSRKEKAVKENLESLQEEQSAGGEHTRVEPNALLDLMRQRRSIRAYKRDPIPREYVETILEAARWAPSGENLQPGLFIVVDDKETIKELGLLGARSSGKRFLMQYLKGEMQSRFASLPPDKREKVMRKLYEGRVSGFIADAPLLIAFCAKNDEGVDTPFDLSAAAQNALLMATVLGLGACWVIGTCKDMRDERKTRILLGVPDGYHVYFLVTFGFPAESPGPRPRKPLSDITFKDRLGQPYFTEIRS